MECGLSYLNLDSEYDANASVKRVQINLFHISSF